MSGAFCEEVSGFEVGEVEGAGWYEKERGREGDGLCIL